MAQNIWHIEKTLKLIIIVIIIIMIAKITPTLNLMWSLGWSLDTLALLRK